MKTNRKKNWLEALGFLLLIYATIPLGRPLTDFLQKRIPLNKVINIVYIVFLVGIYLLLLRRFRIKKFLTYFWLSLLGGIYLYFLFYIRIPIEKIHFIEYGLLAFMILRALKTDMRDGLAYFLALISTGILGWIDEGIQSLLPGRYYDPRDILFNVIGGILGLLMTLCISREVKYRD